MKERMKKIATLLFTVVMLTTLLAGCGSGAAPAASSGSASGSAPASSSADKEWTPDSVAGALKGVTLNVATSGTYGPFSYYDSDGSTLIGYDMIASTKRHPFKIWIRTGCDENGMNEIIQYLNGMMLNFRQESGHILSIAEQMSSNSQNLAQGATEQAGAVEELLSTVHEISSKVSETAAQTSQASEKADLARKQASKSNEQMQSLIGAMLSPVTLSVTVTFLVPVVSPTPTEISPTDAALV